ncbi:MAG: hypothetical protein P8L31_05860 [Pseudomonadales bacterium]|jgi:cation diffusion facilitator CzcD-associated flavoprotein CzcO|nr:hypothetical protein [Pseudomonadales bacterium]
MITERINAEVKDPELAATLTPDYPFFCKHALFIDDYYYSTFNRDDITLVQTVIQTQLLFLHNRIRAQVVRRIIQARPLSTTLGDTLNDNTHCH